MQGEPQLGSMEETTYTYDRNDIIDRLVDLFNGDVPEDTSATIEFGYEDVDIGTYLDQDDIDTINEGLNRFLDDDWGTNKITDYLYGWFDKHLPDHIEEEFTETNF